MRVAGPLSGRLLIAQEGINGTVCARHDANRLDTFIALTSRIGIPRVGDEGAAGEGRIAAARDLARLGEAEAGVGSGGGDGGPFASVDWKRSSGSVEPFPDLKVGWCGSCVRACRDRKTFPRV